MERVIKYYNKDRLTSIIKYDSVTREISVENFSDFFLDTAFGNSLHPTWREFEVFLQTRVVPKGRDKIKEYLEEKGISVYDPYLICRKTHGVMAHDYHWMQFDDEPNLTWENDIVYKYTNWEDLLKELKDKENV